VSVLSSIPWLLPGAAISALLGLLLARPLSARLRTHPIVAGALVTAFGVVLAATLTPSPDSLAFGARSSGICDLSRMWPATPMDLARFDDVAQNVLLFVPLGAIIASLGSRRISLTLLGAAIALPFVIELTQLVVRPLDRSCQSADVFDNLTGLLIGYAVIAIVRAARRHGHGPR
jgi:hypothetical protein